MGEVETLMKSNIIDMTGRNAFLDAQWPTIAAQQVRGLSGTISAVVNALAKAGIELGENGSIFPRPKGKTLKGAPTEADCCLLG